MSGATANPTLNNELKSLKACLSWCLTGQPAGQCPISGPNPMEGYPLLPWPMPLRIPEIGCDGARFGDDFTATHVRVGPKSMYHDEVNGQDTVVTAKKLMAMADYYALWFNQELSKLVPSDRELQRPITGRHIPIKIDDSGVGGGITDMVMAAGYKAIPINSSNVAIEKDAYPNRRSELWFSVAERARAELVEVRIAPLDVDRQALDPREVQRPGRHLPRRGRAGARRQVAQRTHA